MYCEHKYIKTPPKETTIWRYMDLWKFLDILDNKKLHLSRTDTFEDKLEGRVPFKNFEKDDKKDPALEIVDNSSKKDLVKCTYISCWNLNEKETYTLWKTYTNVREGIAIKTTVGNLIDSISIEKEKQQYIGKVEYINTNEKYCFKGNTFQLFFQKRDYFSSEKELRILTEYNYKDYFELQNLPLDIKIDIDYSKLIKEIYLSPITNDSFKKLIELKLKSINLDVPVKTSNI